MSDTDHIYGFLDDKSKKDISTYISSLNESILSLSDTLDQLSDTVDELSGHVDALTNDDYLLQYRRFIVIEGEKLLAANDVTFVQFTQEQLWNNFRIRSSEIEDYVVVSSMWKPDELETYPPDPKTWVYNDNVPFTINGYTSKFRIEMTNSSSATYPLFFAIYSTTAMVIDYRVVLMNTKLFPLSNM